MKPTTSSVACLALLAGAALTVSLPAQAQISDDVVKIGVLTDLSSWGRDNSGPGSVEAARMAAEEFGGMVAGKKIEIIAADHQMKPDIGLQIAREWYDIGKVDAIADVPNSAIGIAVHNLARDKNKIALLSGPGSSEITNKLCSPNTVHFAYDTYALAKVTANAMIQEGGKNWYFLTADYAFGHALEKDATAFIQKAGGAVLGHVLHPTGTNDFSSFLVQAQSSKSNVIGFANAGQDAVNALKQAAEFGVGRDKSQRIVSLLMFDTDIHAAGLPNAQGVLMTTASYWDMNAESRAWSEKFFQRTKVMPSMIHAGVYGSVLHYLKAIKETASDEPAKVMAKMRATRINDVFTKDAYLREDGRVIRDMYLARVKTPQESKKPWDYLEIVRSVKGEDAYRPVAESECPLLKKS
jgi:branched-chain amino acid transport system substrate-binding protein